MLLNNFSQQEAEIKSDVIRNRKILIVDDHRNIRISLKLTLDSEGAETVEAATCQEALKLLFGDPLKPRVPYYDCVLLDIRLPDGSGLDILEKLAAANLAHRVIMISGEGTVSDAFRATQMGAFDYIEKPFGEERIIVTVARCLSFNRLAADRDRLTQQVGGGREILGNSEKLQEVLKLIKRVAPTQGRVLITGESGTGKELVAKALHQESARSDKPMVKVNCAAIPANLMESELFGHEKGAFTGAIKQRQGVFERAHGGTLFLDEIGELPLDLQAKLLRALQNGEIQRVGSDHVTTVDVRLLAATNRNLEDMIASGEFREDLYYRLNVITINLAPLRERRHDIPLLANHFLQLACIEHALGERQFSPSALVQLQEYRWPGNIRELRNIVERTAILSESDTIDVIENLASPSSSPCRNVDSHQELSGSTDFTLACASATWQEFHEVAGREFLKFTLKNAGGNISEAARILCLERAYLHRLMKKLGVQRDIVID